MLARVCTCAVVCAAAIPDQSGPWPYGPVDAMSPRAKPSLREFFEPLLKGCCSCQSLRHYRSMKLVLREGSCLSDGSFSYQDWHAVDDELSEMRLRQLLNVQWEADGHSEGRVVEIKSKLAELYGWIGPASLAFGLGARVQTSGMPELYFRILQSGIYYFGRNESLPWKRFHEQYTQSFFFRKHLFNKFVDCSYRKVKKLKQPGDCYHYRYVAKTESQLLAVAGRNRLDQLDERFRQARIKPTGSVAIPTGGYHHEPEALSPDRIAVAARGCMIEESSVNCSFRRPRHMHGRQRGRLAVLVTGLKDRYYPLSVFKHVVEPATRAGLQVDYYALLDWAKTTMVHHLTNDPDSLFNPVKSGGGAGEDVRSIANPQMANASMRQVLSLVSRYGRKYGAGNLFLRFMDPGLREDVARMGCNRYIGEGTAQTFNYRRTRLTYKNVQVLWQVVQAFLLQEGTNSTYTHVLWQREDMYWVADLDLSNFQDPKGVHAYTMLDAKCEPFRASAAPDTEFSDKTLLMGGEAAASFLKLYDIVNCRSARARPCAHCGSWIWNAPKSVAPPEACDA